MILITHTDDYDIDGNKFIADHDVGDDDNEDDNDRDDDDDNGDPPEVGWSVRP